MDRYRKKYGLLIVLLLLCSVCMGIEIPIGGTDSITLSSDDSVIVTISPRHVDHYTGKLVIKSEEDKVLLLSGNVRLDGYSSLGVKEGISEDYTYLYWGNIHLKRFYSGAMEICFIADSTYNDVVNLVVSTCNVETSVYGISHERLTGGRVKLSWMDWDTTSLWRVVGYDEGGNCVVNKTVSEPSIVLDKVRNEEVYYVNIHGEYNRYSCVAKYEFSEDYSDVTLCSDFTNLYSPDVVGTIGSYSNPFSEVKIKDLGPNSRYSRHTIHRNCEELDFNTGGRLRTVPPGEDASIRLGNASSGSQAESITYKYRVDTSEYDMLIMKYAAVLENPGHLPEKQPRFRFMVLDENKEEINPECYSADYVANASLGWHQYYLVLWKDWTTVGVNLDPFHNQDIYIRFITYDCKEGAHFGYAYFTLKCGNKVMESTNCGDVDSITFIAPEGFTYEWYKLDTPNVLLSTDQSYQAVLEGEYKCKMSMVGATGANCGFEMYAEMGKRYPYAGFSIEEIGDSCDYQIRFNDNSVVTTDSAHTELLNIRCDNVKWDFGDGDTSIERNPIHTYRSRGIYEATMVASLANGQCTDTARMMVPVGQRCAYKMVYDTCCGDSYLFFDTIVTSPGVYRYVTDSITLDLHLTMYGYSPVQYADTVVENQLPRFFMKSRFDTIVEDSMFVIPDIHGCDSMINYSLMVYYNEDTVINKEVCDNMLPYVWNGVVFDSAGSKNCTIHTCHGADSVLEMNLIVHSTYDMEVYDSICDGSEYRLGGEVYDEPGEYNAVLETVHQCDSVVELHLGMYDIEETVEYMKYCRGMSIVWQDGNEYNAPTTEPSVVLKTLKGCDSVVHLVLDSSIIDAHLVADPLVVTYENSKVTLTDESTDGVDRIWYLPDMELSDVVWQYDYPLTEDSVKVMLVAMDAFHCADTAEVWLHKNTEDIWVPNVFTPDEMTNSRFKIFGENLLDIDVMIFNRHGQMVYRYNTLDGGWDGMSNGVKCPQAAYAYKVKYHFKGHPERTKTKVGTVLLLR